MRKGTTTKKKPTTTKKKSTTTRKTTASKPKKFFIKVPYTPTSAADERNTKADARKSFKGVTFPRR